MPPPGERFRGGVNARGRLAGGVALALLAVACGRAPGDPVVRPPEGFDPGELIDVLSPDAIPAIDRPEHETTGLAAEWLTPESPVVAVEVGGDARAYPLAILTRHEIVNDEIGGQKVAVTYCPLCNSAVVYRRAVAGTIVEFGVSGKLYRSDLVMYDRQTDSLWPQMLGRAVRGPLEGTELEEVPSAIVSFGEFRRGYPGGRVLARPGEDRYEANPYPGYDAREGPFADFFVTDPDPRLPSMERVVGVAVGSAARAYPYGRIGAGGSPAVVGDRIGDLTIVVLWQDGARSALDARTIADGRSVGSTGVFEARAGNRDLTFGVSDGRITDAETGSTWTILGRADSGPLEGQQLPPVHHLDAFWFAWAAFVPFTEVWAGA